MNSLRSYILRSVSDIFSLFRRAEKKGRELPHSPERILLVKTHAIGDTIMITPAIKALRNKFQKAHIVLLTGRLSAEAIEGNTDIDEILSFDESALFAPRLGEIIKLIKVVRKEHFDMAFIFHYSCFIHLLVLAFGVPFRIGYDKDGSGYSLTHKVPWDGEDERWTADVHLDLVRSVGAETADKRLRIELSEDTIQFADNFLRDHKVGREDLLIGIFPGGGKNPRDAVYQKRWGVEKYATIIDTLSARYEARIIIFGSQSDEKVTSKLSASSNPEVINTCGKVDLKQLSALIEKCFLLITNDSAPLHIAVAVDTPTISLFGPTRASVFLEKNEKHIAIQSTCPCSPCYSNSVFPGCDNPQCMDAIGSDEVLAAAEKQLGRYNGRIM